MSGVAALKPAPDAKVECCLSHDPRPAFLCGATGFTNGVIWTIRGTVICFVTPFFFWLEFCGLYWRLARPARDPPAMSIKITFLVFR